MIDVESLPVFLNHLVIIRNSLRLFGLNYKNVMDYSPRIYIEIVLFLVNSGLGLYKTIFYFKRLLYIIYCCVPDSVLNIIDILTVSEHSRRHRDPFMHGISGKHEHLFVRPRSQITGLNTADAPGYVDGNGRQHVAENIGSTRACVMCSKSKIRTPGGGRVYTRYKCQECNVVLCKGIRNCFKEYHDYLGIPTYP